MMHSVFDPTHQSLGSSLTRVLASVIYKAGLSTACWFLVSLFVSGEPVGAQSPSQDLRGFETFSIMDIQGTEILSPLANSRVATSGVVTQWTADGSGFWIQDPKGDGDPATSDGLFVLLGPKPGVTARPVVGDQVKLIGQVEEEQRRISPPRTQISKLIWLKIVAHDQPLPEPVPLLDLPDSELSEAIAFWEPLEGMRVSLKEARVIGPTNGYGELVVLTMADAVAGSGYYPEQQTMLTRNLGKDRVDYNPERILIGDASLPSPLVVRPGDEIKSLVGVVDFTFGNFKVQLGTYELQKLQQPPSPPISIRSGSLGNTRVTVYNLRDLFDTVDNPERFDENFDPGSGRRGLPSAEEVDIRLEKHALAIIQELELPDIIVSVEFESAEIFQKIGDRVNERAATRYKAASLETSDRRGLEVGFLFDEERVEMIEVYQMSNPEVEAAFGLTSAFRTREPLVGVFRLKAGGPPLTLIACKFKSKRLDSPLISLNARPIRITERQRKVQARAVRGFANSILDKDPNALVMVAGDLGDMQFAEPGEGTDHPIAILEGFKGEVALKNLVDLEEESQAYTWIFQGNGQMLSHILVSPALLQLTVGADVLHFNSHFPDAILRFDPTTPLRASDRDPLEARFNFASEP